MTSRVRLEVLQWYALLGGAVAWAAQHVVGFFVSTQGCSAAGSSNTELWQIVLAVAAGIAVCAAEAAALVVYRATSGAGKDAPGPAGRLHFFAQAALVGNILFFVVIVLDSSATIASLPCGAA
ncbi:MAG TPA: hypothetical protein VIJ70_08390 [Gaiellaceae bacterium]